MCEQKRLLQGLVQELVKSEAAEAEEVLCLCQHCVGLESLDVFRAPTSNRQIRLRDGFSLRPNGHGLRLHCKLNYWFWPTSKTCTCQIARLERLAAFEADLGLPRTVWLSGLRGW